MKIRKLLSVGETSLNSTFEVEILELDHIILTPLWHCSSVSVE